MLSFDDIKNLTQLDTRIVKIESLGGEIKVRELTIAQATEVHCAVKDKELNKALALTAKYGVIVPDMSKMSIDDILGWSQKRTNVLVEISNAISELTEAKVEGRRRFIFKLALALGMTVLELEQKMSERELNEWMEYYKHEPFLADRVELQIASAMANYVNANSKHRYKYEDFMLTHREKNHKELENKLKVFFEGKAHV